MDVENAFAGRVERDFIGRVDGFLGKEPAGRSAGNHAEQSALGHAAAEIVDELAQREADARSDAGF